MFGTRLGLAALVVIWKLGGEDRKVRGGRGGRFGLPGVRVGVMVWFVFGHVTRSAIFFTLANQRTRLLKTHNRFSFFVHIRQDS